MSPSLLSVASLASLASAASSSVGEQYGSSFEEDTEGSSSCSAAGGGAAGGGSGGWAPESAAPVPAVVASIPGRKNKILAGGGAGGGGGGGGDQNAGYFVMTPGSVGTETTATPSSAGIASSTRGGKEYSGAGIGGGLDRNSAVNRFTSVGSSASLGSESSTAANTTTTTIRDGGNDFAATALSFRRAAGCYSSPASDRVSTSSWTLSAGVSSLRVSEEVVDGAARRAVGRGRSGTGSAISGVPEERERQLEADTAVHGRTPPPGRAVVTSATGGGGGSPRSGVAESGAGRRHWVERRRTACSPSAVDNNGGLSDEVQREQPPLPLPLPPTPPPPPPRARASVVMKGGAAAGGGYEEDLDACFEREGRGGGAGASASTGGGGRGVCVSRDVGEYAFVHEKGDVCGRFPVRRGLRELLLHTSDAQVTPIVGSRSVDSSGLPSSATQHRHQTGDSAGAALKQLRHSSSRVDQLPFEALLPETVRAMPPPELEAHLTVAYNALTEASAPVRQKGQTLLYLQSLALIPRVANLLVNSTFLVLLLR